MKKILLSLALFASSNDIFSQSTIAPMLEIGKKWSSLSYASYPDPQHPYAMSKETLLEITGDTLIQDVEYYILKKVVKSQSGSCYYCSDFQNSISYSIPTKLFLRQNGNTVIYKSSPESIEKILYHFTGLRINDTIQTDVELNGQFASYKRAIISKVDTIKIGGENVRRFRLKFSKDKEPNYYFFDGIGMDGGGLEPIESFFGYGTGFNLNCLKNGNNIFGYDIINETFTSPAANCDLILNVNDINKNINTVLIKRLSDNVLQIETSIGSGEFEAILLNLNGQTIINHSSLKGNIIDIKNLKSGLHIMKISFKNGSIHTSKIVK